MFELLELLDVNTARAIVNGTRAVIVKRSDQTFEEVIAAMPEEDPWLAVRLRRNTLLRDSDVMVLADRWAAMTAPEREAWTVYRQALRDIPQRSRSALAVTWPQKPA
jgi:hypothetical protein